MDDKFVEWSSSTDGPCSPPSSLQRQEAENYFYLDSSTVRRSPPSLLPTHGHDNVHDTPLHKTSRDATVHLAITETETRSDTDTDVMPMNNHSFERNNSITPINCNSCPQSQSAMFTSERSRPQPQPQTQPQTQPLPLQAMPHCENRYHPHPSSEYIKNSYSHPHHQNHHHYEDVQAHPSQRRRVCDGTFQPLHPHPQAHYGAPPPRPRDYDVDHSDREVEMITSRERLWTHHHYRGYAYPAYGHAHGHSHGASPHAYHNHYRHHHHHHPSPSPRSHFYAPHPYSSYHHHHHNYHHTHHQHQHQYNPSTYRRSSCYEQSSREQRKRKIRSNNRGRKDFIIQVDRSISPALSDITASPTPSTDMSDDLHIDDMHVDVQQYQSILQPLLECQKTSNVGVGVSLNVKDLRVDTNITMNHEEIEVETPRVERMSSTKKQTSFNWDIDMNMKDDNVHHHNDEVVRTVSPLKSGQKSSDEDENDHDHDRDVPTPMATRTANTCGAQHKVADNEKNASVWREKNENQDPLDGSSLRYLISNNVSQSSSELCEAI